MELIEFLTVIELLYVRFVSVSCNAWAITSLSKSSDSPKYGVQLIRETRSGITQIFFLDLCDYVPTKFLLALTYCQYGTI